LWSCAAKLISFARLAAGFFTITSLGVMLPSGSAMGLEGWRFALAVVANFFLGALMCVGIGHYVPSMALRVSRHASDRRLPDHDRERRRVDSRVIAYAAISMLPSARVEARGAADGRGLFNQ
jgi:hypothetical protein